MVMVAVFLYFSGGGLWLSLFLVVGFFFFFFLVVEVNIRAAALWLPAFIAVLALQVDDNSGSEWFL